jgi:hypothetical protein
MERRLAAVIVSLAVTLQALALAAPTQAGPGPRAEALQRPIKQVTREYGDGPVTVPKKTNLSLRFHGKRGDRVTLGVITDNDTYVADRGDLDLVLVGPDGRVKQGRDGYWRLRDKGRHTFEFHPARRALRVQLLLQKRVVHDVDRVQRLRERRGYQYVVRLTVPKSGLRVTTFDAGVHRLFTRRHGLSRFFVTTDAAFLLRPGAGVDASWGTITKPLEAGDRVWAYVDAGAPARVDTTVPTALPVAIDGADTPLPAGTPTAVSFDGAQGQLVRIHRSADTPGWAAVLLGPSDSRVPWTAMTVADPQGGRRSAGLYLLPAPGRYQLVMLPGMAADTLAIDSLVQAPAIDVDGPAGTLPVPSDGRWVVAPIARPVPADVVASAVTIVGRWEVFAGELPYPRCPARGPLGCGDFRTTFVNQDDLTNGPIWYGGHVVFAPLEGQTAGSVDVRLVTPPSG